MAEEAHKEPTMEEILASIRKIISEDDEPRSQIAPESQAQMRTVDPEPVVEAASAPDMALEEDDSMFEEFDLSDITETASEAPAPETPQPSPLDIAEEDEAESAAGDVFEDVELPVIEDEAPGMAVEEEVFDLPELDADPEPEPEFAPEPEAEFAPEPEIEVDTVKVEAAPVPTPEIKSESPAEVKMQAALTESSTEAAAAGALARLVAKMDMGSENTLEGMVRELLKPMIKEWLDANLPAIVEDKVEAEVQRIARLAR